MDHVGKTIAHFKSLQQDILKVRVRAFRLRDSQKSEDELMHGLRKPAAASVDNNSGRV